MSRVSKSSSLSDSEVQTIVKEYNNGKSSMYLSKLTGLSDWIIRNVLRDNGVSIRGKIQFSGEDTAYIVDEYTKGISVNSLAVLYKVTHATISKHLRKQGISVANHVDLDEQIVSSISTKLGEGFSAHQIATELQVSINLVNRAIKSKTVLGESIEVNNNLNKYCVYAHYRKDNNEMFYIGQGTASRPFVKDRKLKIWNDIVEAAGGFTVKVIKDKLSKNQALSLEKEYIDKYSNNLVNKPTSSSTTKTMDFDLLSERFYIDATSPSGLRYKKDVFAHVKAAKSYSIIHKKDSVAGNQKPDSTWSVGFLKQNNRVHRIVFLLHHGYISDSSELVIDHIDGNSLNNCVSNLREIPVYLNVRNKKVDKRNKLNLPGISVNKNNTYKSSVSLLDGSRFSRSFSFAKYGKEEALRLAVEWRRDKLLELNEQGAGYTDRHINKE